MKDTMEIYDLLVIDPQNDFMDIQGAALPVPGAQADMDRLAHWLQAHTDAVQSITITLDSHASVGIERTTFWQQGNGGAVMPFTPVTAADVVAGRYLPRHAQMLPDVMVYLTALEAPGQRQLVVWPVHCVLGTWGHNIHAGLAQAVAYWEQRTGLICDKVLKGLNPMTEQYSAFRAEVPRDDDARTRLNQSLLGRLASGRGTLLVAGEALSHCVAASVRDMMVALPAARLAQMVLLTDCMSPVGGFEAVGQAFLQEVRDWGVKHRVLHDIF